MPRLLLFISMIGVFHSCDSSNDNTAIENHPIEESVETETTFSVEIDQPTIEDFTWSFLEGKTENGQLQTDVGLLFNRNGAIDTVRFFTARGKWNELKTTENGIINFPENCKTAIQSKAESCFWAVRLKEGQKFEVLFGGIENDSAFAVLEYGYIDLSEKEIQSEVGDPEEIETYTQYGTQLY